MDDMLVFETDKNALLNIDKTFRFHIEDKLNLVLKPACLHSVQQGIPFLGYVIKNDGLTLLKSSKLRFLKKLKCYNQYLLNNIWHEKEYQNHILPLLAFAQKASTKYFLKTTMLKHDNYGYNFQKGSNRVNRGGSWGDIGNNCRVSNRNNNSPSNRNNNLRLRLCLP